MYPLFLSERNLAHNGYIQGLRLSVLSVAWSWKINNVLCYFCERDALVKLKLLRVYCSDFYGCVLWDLSQSSVEDVCIAWRRGLRRVWGLPHRTHAALIAPLRGLLPLKVELACRCAGFITKCFRSANQTVRLIATQGVYSQRMLSPTGRNAQNCAAMFEVSISNIAAISKRMARTRAEAQMSKTDFDKLKVISELLCVKHHYNEFRYV